jgi:hypothetical protein
VQTHQINVSRARDMVQAIRHELFEFPEVLDVFVTGRPDWLVIVSRGRPRPGEWLRALRAVGYHVPVRRHATQAAEADRHGAAAPASAPARGLTARAEGRVPDCVPAIAVLASAVPAGQPWTTKRKRRGDQAPRPARGVPGGAQSRTAVG